MSQLPAQATFIYSQTIKEELFRFCGPWCTLTAVQDAQLAKQARQAQPLAAEHLPQSYENDKKVPSTS